MSPTGDDADPADGSWPRQLVDAIPLPALVFDDDDRLVAANVAAAGTFGTLGATQLTVLQALGNIALADAVRAARTRRGAVELDARVGERDVSGLASPVGDVVLIVVSDRTAQRRLGDLRRDFVANASHELKTPVAGLQALIDALGYTLGADVDRARSLVGRLEHEASRLSKLVHDLLDLSRLEADERGDVTTFDLGELVRQQVDLVADVAAVAGVELAVDLPEYARLAGTERDVLLVVRNLLDNAVRYNRDGGTVTVSVAREGAGYVLTVADTGIGIAQGDLHRIFERFYRVDVARSRATGGTGLGLSLVRHAVDRLGGQLEVDSTLGEGTSFRVVVPVEPPRR